MEENACAVLAPGQPPNNSTINISDFHCAAGYSHEVLLHKTAEQQGIVLEGGAAGVQRVLHGEGSSQGHLAVNAHTSGQADKKLGSSFVFFLWI